LLIRTAAFYGGHGLLLRSRACPLFALRDSICHGNLFLHSEQIERNNALKREIST
jgi:hypothetical protein